MIYLITPSNLFLMPYVKSYIELLEEQNIEYKIFYWNRVNKYEDVNHSIVYKDSKNQLNRNLLDYLKYILFIKKNLQLNKDDKLIIFSFQLLLLIYLLPKPTYLVDIRDFHKIASTFFIRIILKKSKFIIGSSPAFREYINNSNYYVWHNFSGTLHQKMINLEDKFKKIVISNIGAIRDYEANKELINLFKNDNRFILKFHGLGPDSERLSNYVIDNEIDNVFFTGEYKKEDESDLYLSSTFINLVRDNTSLNNKIALPNRLYYAASYNKPVIVTSKTILENYVKEYDLGLIFQNDEAFKYRLLNYSQRYEGNNKIFLKSVIEENDKTKRKILNSVVN